MQQESGTQAQQQKRPRCCTLCEIAQVPESCTHEIVEEPSLLLSNVHKRVNEHGDASSSTLLRKKGKTSTAASSSVSSTEELWACPICCDALGVKGMVPLLLQTCKAGVKHMLCMSCFMSCEQKHCPICRAPYNGVAPIALTELLAKDDKEAFDALAAYKVYCEENLKTNENDNDQAQLFNATNLVAKLYRDRSLLSDQVTRKSRDIMDLMRELQKERRDVTQLRLDNNRLKLDIQKIENSEISAERRAVIRKHCYPPTLETVNLELHHFQRFQKLCELDAEEHIDSLVTAHRVRNFVRLCCDQMYGVIRTHFVGKNIFREVCIDVERKRPLLSDDFDWGKGETRASRIARVNKLEKDLARVLRLDTDTQYVCIEFKERTLQEYTRARSAKPVEYLRFKMRIKTECFEKYKRSPEFIKNLFIYLQPREL